MGDRQLYSSDEGQIVHILCMKQTKKVIHLLISVLVTLDQSCFFLCSIEILYAK